MKALLKVRYLLLLASCSCLVLSAVVARSNAPAIDSQSALESAINSASPGDSIIIKDGEYRNWSIKLHCSGKEDAPIIIQPESPGGVVLTGSSSIKLSGKYILLKGLVFSNCVLDGNSLVEFDGASNCQATGLLFRDSGGNRPIVQFKAGSADNSISDCQFINIAGRSVHVQVNDSVQDLGAPVRNVIRNNIFMDIPPLGNNGRETVKIGQDQPRFGHVKTYTVVENNLFIRCDGEAEIISNKAASNVFRGNTFIDCMGELVMRGGHDCLIENNRFANCRGGIRLSGTGHMVHGNFIVGSEQTGIRLLYGMTREQGGHYQAASNCRITDNVIIDAGRMGILVGDGRNKDWKEKGIQQFAPANNEISGNLILSSKGNFLYVDHAPDNRIEANSFSGEQ